ncbi:MULTISPECIES: uridine kinase [Actinoplanes]|uniref:uridine kinase n=1 Tax=Actinoplanes TaxID=1865 RepID=UPI001FE08ECC|nr:MULTISPECIES: uridine kinase [Actinoplanes]GLY07161.1 uridine kinase [Actinoplanes sp. NBRC 101535]
MISSPRRQAVLATIAGRIPAARGTAPVLVAIDGPDGSGKTVAADALATTVRALGREVVRISLDDFHHVRAVRYRRGRHSPEGFWQDSYDYPRFREFVLEPFAPGGSRRYRPAGHDLATDELLTPEPRTAGPASVLIVDGLFLQRTELAGTWDLTVFLDVPFAETARRMAIRDGSSPDPSDAAFQRYAGAQRIYFKECSPQQNADILVDNEDVTAPRIVHGA